ncbi:hypothetical protein HTS88_12030 [Pseudarthrobacter oxydans]|uniref:hypothetical protein n=1 Tax=Pseudarthrobacter oxydans TaxID=1671 RepID=UPI0015723AE1|nr:hypothetical protein [Pseudarthrobacter oxydans]NSX37134.1 hypothetical protein [Pseudarthrobacter oxydans]
MAIAVILDLASTITLGDMKHFLSLAPADMSDDDEILCLPDFKTGHPYYLAIPTPAASSSPIDPVTSPAESLGKP